MPIPLERTLRLRAKMLLPLVSVQKRMAKILWLWAMMLVLLHLLKTVLPLAGKLSVAPLMI